MWIITRDLFVEKDSPIYDPSHVMDGSAVGITSPFYDESILLQYEFRLLDDDDNVYYYGFCSTNDDEAALSPLDDWAEADSGCMSIQYLVNGEWETL